MQVFNFYVSKSCKSAGKTGDISTHFCYANPAIARAHSIKTTHLIGDSSKMSKKNPYLDTSKLESFLVDLDDKIHYRYLTFSTLAKHILENDKKTT
jgi:hypothetical protein